MSQRAGRVRLMLVVALAVSTGACGTVRRLTTRTEPVSAEEVERTRLEELKARAREAVPVSPQVAQPGTAAGTRVWRTALGTRGLRVMVGTESRALWLMRDSEVLFRAPVAVGMEEDFTYRGKRYDFDTPLGRRKVQAKGTMPLWVPPDWHYFEIAHEQNLEAVHLRKGQRVRLTDGTIIEVRGNEVGRINQFGNFWPFTPGNEIIFDGRIFIPPIGTRQRQVPEILGTHKLEIGDSYLIHGTNMDTSIGDAVSHGCVRMYNEDVARLFELVPVGTPVFIF